MRRREEISRRKKAGRSEREGKRQRWAYARVSPLCEAYAHEVFLLRERTGQGKGSEVQNLKEKEKESEGMRLMEKGKRGLLKLVFSRTGLIVVLLALQILVLIGVFHWFGNLLPQIFGGTLLFTVVMVIYLLNIRMDPTAKLTWLVVITLMPVFGALLYWFTRSDFGHRLLRERTQKMTDLTRDKIEQSPKVMEDLKEQSPQAASLATYVGSTGCYPVFENSQVTYFPLGEDKFAELLKQLEEAKYFIFLEYFIIDEGIMWGKILDILARKASEGVIVRVMYDGTNEFSTLSTDYPERLRALGIECKVFSPVVPVVSTHYNYRDHRKILVIDGHTAFTGGVNLADEYINRFEKYGHWKDTAIMVKGEAAKSFTLMFLQMWNIDDPEGEMDLFLAYPTLAPDNAKGFVLPYADCPLDSDKVGEEVYISMLHRAERYVHIMTPYLILDGELENAIKYAAQRGVDVKIILPGVPDKAAPYALAKTHYAALLDAGVKIYEYGPGFVHAKVFVVDDREAVVGTINLDYRSLYHHFECAAWMYDTDCIPDIEKDFQTTLLKCRTVTKKSIWLGRKILKPFGILLKVIAPLM